MKTNQNKFSIDCTSKGLHWDKTFNLLGGELWSTTKTAIRLYYAFFFQVQKYRYIYPRLGLGWQKENTKLQNNTCWGEAHFVCLTIQRPATIFNSCE